MSFFTFRLNKIRITNNREFFPWDKAEVKILSFVTGDTDFLPSFDGYAEANAGDQRKMVEAAAKAAIGRVELQTVENIRDGQQLFFGDTGIVLYRSMKSIPVAFDWSLFVYESDEDKKKIGEFLTSLVNSATFGGLVDEIVTLAVGTNPATLLGVKVGKFVIGEIGNALKKKKWDQIGVLYQSMNKYEHYPNGERKKDDIPDISGNILVDYSIFATDN